MTEIKRFEKFAIILLLVWIFTVIPNRMIFRIMVPFLKSSVAVDQVSVMQTTLVTAQSLLAHILKVVIAIWVFIQASRDGSARWVWALFALFYGMSALILYFIFDLLKEIRSLKTEIAK